MTSRTGPGREPIQRSFSSTNTFSRPSPHRTSSQQYPSSSPTRRTNDGLVDLTLDGDAAGRPAPRIGTSRLRLEVSTDSKSTLVESPALTSETHSTRKPSPSFPPRGRPILHFHIPSSSQPSPDAAGQDELTSKPLPLPRRPGQHAPPASEKPRPLAGAAPQKKELRPKPYVLETPSIAPHYPPNGHADFFPWTGNHAEDQFSEPVIRGGYFDKASMTQNETGSARPAIFPALKLKSGLQTLSSLFTSVLAQRRAHGQITSASTFKPPPRVTVTDTKREMWLKDLANPTISLRRLSRSIPHGIRGKVLLDQSLSKSIPIERAVWLAKCVGANELRSFRRKGVTGTFAMGGEAKWIRDFTVCVEQFVESIAGTCGEKDFRARIDYAIRLATHFYAEHLLDQDHYLDWLVSSVKNTPQAKLPLWLLITEIHWKDVLQYRKFGRRLAAALVHHFSVTFEHIDHDILSPLSDRLLLLLKRLMISNPESFISPKSWLKHRDVLSAKFSAEGDNSVSVFLEIDRRNSRLDTSGVEKEVSTHRRILGLLDSTVSQALGHELISQWWEMDKDKDMLVQTVLGWATSSHRPGTAKIYIATRILRIWSHLGADTTSAILTFIEHGVSETGRNNHALYHLVSELARSRHFSTPRYLQWLITRGGLREAADVSPDAPCRTRLLAELPTHNLSDGILELRTTLLNRAAFSVEKEEKQIRAFMTAINAKLPDLETGLEHDIECVDAAPSLEIMSSISSSSRTCKSDLGLWLRQKIRTHLIQPKIPPLDDWDVATTSRERSAITVSDFDTVRQYLELIDDYTMLADIMMLVTSSDDNDVLASCADTLNLHLDTFSAIGALKGLFDKLISRLRSLNDDLDLVPRSLLLSLAELAARISEQEMLAQQLAQELFRSDRKTAADACSPVSDHMAVIETAEADFTDEIEKVLASGTSMDQGTLDRLFQRIIQRLEASCQKSPEQQRSCSLLLTRLKTFDRKSFDALMTAWVTQLLTTSLRPDLAIILSPLISLGCLAIGEVVQCYSTLSDTTLTPRTTLEMLFLIVEPSIVPGVIDKMEAYRLLIKQAHMQKDHPADVLLVIRKALGSCSDENGIMQSQPTAHVESFFATQSMRTLLQRLILHDPDAFVQKLVLPLLQNGTSKAIELLNATCDYLLVGEHGPKQVTTEVLLSTANDLSLPFCQVKLSLMLRDNNTTIQNGEHAQSDPLDDFDNAITSAVHSGNTAWASIVPLLDGSVARHLRHRAEQHFLSLFPSPKSLHHDHLHDIQDRVGQAENVLRIINATARRDPVIPSLNVWASTLGPDIVATCNGIWLLLSSLQTREIKDCVITEWLPLLLSFVTFRSSAFDTTKIGHENRARTVLAVTAIYLQLQGLDIDTDSQKVDALTEQTFDLALFLMDSLSEDMRLQCIRSLRDTLCNPQVSYMLSYCSNPSEWLVMVQKERSVGAEFGPAEKEKLTPFVLRRWENLGEPTPNVGENDTSLSLTLFGARRG